MSFIQVSVLNNKVMYVKQNRDLLTIAVYIKSDAFSSNFFLMNIHTPLYLQHTVSNWNQLTSQNIETLRTQYLDPDRRQCPYERILHFNTRCC